MNNNRSNDYVETKSNRDELKPLSSRTALGKVSSLTDENIQELREIILNSGSSKIYQNKKIKDWFLRYFA